MKERIDLNSVETEELVKIDGPVSGAEKELESKLTEYGYTDTFNIIKKFRKYYNILIKWNNVMNLTGITEYNEVVEKHFTDSIAFFKVYGELKKRGEIPQLSGSLLVDIGTGAGFPGVPIALVDSEIKVTLIDSLKKRIDFLNAVINETGITNAVAVHGRSEDLARDEMLRERFDFAVSRAVAAMNTLSEYCIPFVKTGGYFIAYKTGNNKDEIESSVKAINMLGGNIDEIIKSKVESLDYDREYICIKKTEKTKKKYPRKAGEPKNNPL